MGNYAAILSIFFLAALLKGVTGLGFATLCLGMLASFIQIKAAIPMVMLASLTSNVLVILDSGKLREAFVRFWPMYVLAIGGLLVGLHILGASSGAEAKMVLGAVMIVYGLWALWQGDFHIPRRLERAVGLPVGLVTGFVNGLTGSQMMPILPYLMALDIDKNLLIASINMSFTLSSLVMLAGLGRMGLVTMDLLLPSALGVPLVVAGVHLGGKARRKVSERLFRRLVLLLLIGLGFNLLLRS